MSRHNPAWIGRILIRSYDQDGNEITPTLSSTRRTREAALSYLREIAGADTSTAAAVA